MFEIIKISIRSTEDFLDSQELIISTLPFGDSEKSRLVEIKNQSYKTQSLTALVALKDIIPDASDELTISRTDNKKPYFSHSPYHFSLSHAEKISVASICEAPVGIDIELLDANRDIAKLVNRFFNDDEKALLQASDDPLLTFYSIWTKKESLSKISGNGLCDLSRQNSLSCFSHQFVLNIHEESYIMSVCSLTPDEITVNNAYKELTVYEL